MTSSLFQEALADAKQLKEVAEQNAKNAIIDSVTPKIRKFIEEQLLEGSSRGLEDESGEKAVQEEEEIDLTTDGDDSIDTAASETGLAERVGLLRAMSRIAESLTPEESASLIPIVEKMRNAAVNKPGTAGISRAAPSDVRSTHIIKENTAMQGMKNKMYEVDLDELMSDEIGADEAMEDETMEYEAMDDEAAEEEGMEEEAMDDEMADLYESLSALLEKKDEEEEEEEEDDDAPVKPEGGDDAGGVETTPAADGDVAAGIAQLESEMSELKDMLQQLMSMQGGGGAAPSAPAEEEPAPAPAGGEMPPGAEKTPSPSERVYKVDEAALLRELRALREGHNGAYTEKAKKPKGALPEAMEDEAAEDEAMDEAMEDEAMDETSAMPAHTKGHGFSTKTSGAFNAPAKVMKENRDLKESLVKHAEAIESLRGQLTEMNLFNAKLLYVNRLLQDRELSDAQRRNIIESLDRARSLREVKLLYKGLSESIGRKTAAKRPELVSESVGSRAVSPTSRPLSTSGVRLNEAVEVHRWAVLAGIGSKS